MRALLVFFALWMPSLVWAQNPEEEAAGVIGGATICGNGVVEGPEQCDDGNINAEDGCTNTCYIGDPKDPLVGAALTVSGMFFIPVVGASVGYLYVGEREQFRKNAALHALFGAAFYSGIASFLVSSVEEELLPVSIGLVAVGAVGRLVVNISCIVGTSEAINQYNYRVQTYRAAQKKGPSLGSLELRFDDLSVAPLFLPAPEGNTLSGGMIGFRF